MESTAPTFQEALTSRRRAVTGARCSLVLVVASVAVVAAAMAGLIGPVMAALFVVAWFVISKVVLYRIDDDFVLSVLTALTAIFGANENALSPEMDRAEIQQKAHQVAFRELYDTYTQARRFVAVELVVCCFAVSLFIFNLLHDTPEWGEGGTLAFALATVVAVGHVVGDLASSGDDLLTIKRLTAAFAESVTPGHDDGRENG